MKKKIIRKIAGDADFVGSHETIKLGNFRHDRNLERGKEEWLTPPDIIQTFGPFDLDPWPRPPESIRSIWLKP